MGVGARANGVHFKEGTPIAHFAQTHLVDLNARGSEDFESGAHGRVNAANNHDEARAGTGRGRHGIAEMQPSGLESCNTTGILTGQIRPRQGGSARKARKGLNQSIGVQKVKNFNRNNLAGRIQGGQARGLVFRRAFVDESRCFEGRNITPGNRK